MSEYVRFSITLTSETKRKIDAICGDLIPRSRYIESVSSKAERIMAELNESSSELVAFVECA